LIPQLSKETRGGSLADKEITWKYRALGCTIHHVGQEHSDYAQVRNLFVQCGALAPPTPEDPTRDDRLNGLDETDQTDKIKIVRVYRISRDKDKRDFTQLIYNRKLLFHGSRFGSSRLWPCKEQFLTSPHLYRELAWNLV